MLKVTPDDCTFLQNTFFLANLAVMCFLHFLVLESAAGFKNSVSLSCTTEYISKTGTN